MRSCMFESLKLRNADLEFNGKRHVLVKVAGCPCPFSLPLTGPLNSSRADLDHSWVDSASTDRHCSR